jgi:hypothetical protein
MSNQKPYIITPKERLRRTKLRIQQLFSRPHKKLPNFWHDPFEVYLLEHLKRAYHILTYDEYYYVDNCMRNIDKIPFDNDRDSLFVGTINMRTLPNGDVEVLKTRVGFLKDGDSRPIIISENPDNS